MNDWGTGGQTFGQFHGTGQITTGVINGTTLPSTQPESPLSSEIGRIVNGIADLEVTVSELCKQLDPLCLPQPQNTGEANGAGQNTRGAVVDGLATQADRIHRITARLRALRGALVV